MTDDPEGARQAVEAAALRLLARREHGREELARKLYRRGYPSGLVGEVLKQLEAEGSLSESRFAESFARSRAERGYGPTRIRRELEARGVSGPLIEAALASLGVDWREQARRLCRKRFGKRPAQDWKSRARRLRYLQNRGFDPDFLRDFESADE